MAAICPVFDCMLSTAGINAPFRQWLIRSLVLNAEEFSLICTDEAAVTAEVINVALAADPPCTFANVMRKKSVRKLFKTCRAMVLAWNTFGASASARTDEAIPPPTGADLNGLWLEKQGFVIPDAWFLMPTLQGKLWRGEPRRNHVSTCCS